MLEVSQRLHLSVAANKLRTGADRLVEKDEYIFAAKCLVYELHVHIYLQ